MVWSRFAINGGSFTCEHGEWIGDERCLHSAEYQRLNDIYERRRRIWLRYAFPLPGQFPERLDELEHEALLHRNTAAKHMANHQKSCPSCRVASRGGTG